MAKTKQATVVEQTEEVQALDPGVQLISSDRIYQGQMQLDHDLFKLMPADMLTNVAWSGKPRYEPAAHVHFFHTIDSSGRPQSVTNQVGGHLHEVVVEKGPQGFKVVVGPPKRWVQKKMRDGTVRRELVVISHDTHTHDVEYRGSMKVQPRQVNAEFAKIASKLDPQPQNVPNVIEQ